MALVRIAYCVDNAEFVGRCDSRLAASERVAFPTPRLSELRLLVTQNIVSTIVLEVGGATAAIGVGAADAIARVVIAATAIGVGCDYRWCSAIGGRLVAIRTSWITGAHLPNVLIAPHAIT